MDPPQVNAREGGAALVPLAGVGGTTQREPLHADLGDPVSRLAVQWDVMTVEPQVPHAAWMRRQKTDRRETCMD